MVFIISEKFGIVVCLGGTSKNIANPFEISKLSSIIIPQNINIQIAFLKIFFKLSLSLYAIKTSAINTNKPIED